MYPFYSVYEQELTLYTFPQNDLTNVQWYEKFNTRSDVANAIRVTRQHKVILEHVDQGKNSNCFWNITWDEKSIVRVDAEEQYFTYVLLQKIGGQHVKLNSDIHSNYNTGDDR